ncbi:phosphotransferase [uncultured Nitrospira sp.]|uniref:phosphotransferase n=1 Tax=uncultured Nitrospira sp. TaxID=157176 RepID=UPI0031404E82
MLSTIPERLAELVEEHGWLDGVGKILNELDSNERNDLFWEMHLGSQSAWMLWVGRTSQDMVLNLDAGLGTTTVALSYLFSNVTGVFRDEPSSRCAMARARQEGRKIETIPIAGLNKPLPFQDGLFDVICLSNAQVWLEAGGGTVSKGREDISKLFNLLTPGGMIYLGMREGPLFPWIGHDSPRLFQPGLGSALERNSSRVLSRLTFYPTSGPVEAVFQERNKKSWISRCRSTLKKVVKGESYGLIVGKSCPDRSSGVIGDILNHQEGERSDRSDIEVYVGTANALVGKLPDRIVRFPLGGEPLIRCRNNYETLQSLQGNSPVAIPAPYDLGNFGDLRYFAESKLPGVEPTGERKWAWKTDMITAQAFRYLLQLHKATAQKVILDGILFESLVGASLAHLMRYCKGTDKAIVTDIEVLLKERLMGKTVVLVRTHGDFKRTNLLVQESGEVVGLIDWDLSRGKGFPLMDLLWYLSYEVYLNQGIPFYQAIVRMAFEEDLLMNDCVQTYWQELCLGPIGQQKLFAAILLLYQFHEHSDHWHKSDEEWFSHIMMPILRAAFENALGAVAEPSHSVS